MSKKMASKLKPFDKYYYYKRSVQSPDTDVEFLSKAYKEIKGGDATSFREDFCGTFSISCEWVKLNGKHTAYGVDLEPETIEYGRQNYMSKLSEDEQSRITLLNKNVMDKDLPHVDIVCAQNFSYFIFKKREILRKYFENVYRTLNKDGVFVIDIFGGSQCYEPNEEETDHDDFSYYWDQDSFDPVSNEAQFYIHFKRKGEKKRRECFSYDWRMWTLPEVREIMEEAGFSRTHVYWEGTDEDGDGDGEFERVIKGEDCESWIAYVAAEK